MNHHKEEKDTCTCTKELSTVMLTTSKFIDLYDFKEKIGIIAAYVSERKKLCWWSSSFIVETSLTLAKPPSTLV